MRLPWYPDPPSSNRADFRVPRRICALKLSAFRSMLDDADEFVRLSCRESPAGGEMSGLTAHFLFAENSRIFGANSSFFGATRGKSSGKCWIESRWLGGVGTMAAKLDEIRAAAVRVAASHGLDVVDLEFIGPAKERTLRICLEKNAEGRAQLKAAIAAGAEGLPERLVEGKLSVEQLSGITHEDCAAFSRDFGVLLDVEDLIPGAEYTLEASSPGLDRKLTRPEDYARFAGCLVKVQTFEPIRNNRHWQGRLAVGAEAETITLDLNAVKQNSKSRKTGVSSVEIALGNIEKAQLVPEI
jgi:ribosome maturation factor RimP